MTVCSACDTADIGSEGLNGAVREWTEQQQSEAVVLGVSADSTAPFVR